MPRLEETTELSTLAATEATASTMAGGQAYMADVARRLAPYVARSQSRHRAQAYVPGWLREAERQNSWPVAEVCGESTPDGFQDVLSRADWDANAVRDERHIEVIQHLGDPNGVLVLDETGFLNKGEHAAGVARQYSGTAGTVEHCQIGVLLGDASPRGHARRARERYRPPAWTEDGARGRQAGIPADRPVATTPHLAQQMLHRAFTAGVPATCITGDSLDGTDRRLRRGREAQPPADVRAVSGQADVWLEGRQRQVKTILAALPEEGWGRLRAGDGANGPRWYDWRWRPLAAPLAPGGRRWLLVRRSQSPPTELTADGVCAPHATPLQEVVRVAGRRWTVESSCEEAKGEVGLDQDEVRSWTAWYRPSTLAMWALALLTVMRAGTIAVEACNKSLPPPQVAHPLAAFKARRGLASR
jgi:SRSO17 transposase